MDWEQVHLKLQQNEQYLEQATHSHAEFRPQLLQQRAELLASRRAQKATLQSEQYLICSVRQEYFGFAIKELRAVQKFSNCTHLPQSPESLRGVIFFQGQMVSVIELAQLLKLTGQPLQSEGFVLFLRTSPVLGLRIEQIYDLISLPPQQSRADDEQGFLRSVTSEGYQLVELRRFLKHAFFQQKIRCVN